MSKKNLKERQKIMDILEREYGKGEIVSREQVRVCLDNSSDPEIRNRKTICPNWLNGKEAKNAGTFKKGKIDLGEAKKALEKKLDISLSPAEKADAERGRKKVLREIDVRQGQGKFKTTLMKAYAGRCAITGCRIPEILEAAHIIPYCDEQNDDVTNGLLLRSDLHVLFDRDLIVIDPDHLTVNFAPKSKSEFLKLEYSEVIHGQKLLLPKSSNCYPSSKSLHYRKNCSIESIKKKID